MSRSTSAFVAVVTHLVLVAAGAGCRPTSGTGAGLHVGVRAEPPAGYKPPLVSPRGEVFAFGETVATPQSRPAPTSSQAASSGPGFDPIDYRRLGGIILWVEPADGSAVKPTTPDAPGRTSSRPLSAAVDLRTAKRAEMEDVYVASVGGRVTFAGVPAKGPPYVVRTEAGDLTDLAAGGPAFVPTRPGLVEVLGEYGEVVAQVYVVPTPWARKLRTGERATFAPLPPGRYRVSTWHPVLPGSSEVVAVAAGPLVKLTLTVGVHALPKPAAPPGQ